MASLRLRGEAKVKSSQFLPPVDPCWLAFAGGSTINPVKLWFVAVPFATLLFSEHGLGVGINPCH